MSLSGYNGEGLSATAAQLDSPQGLTKDNSGRYYIADTGNNLVRRVGINGNIQPLIGMPNINTYNGDFLSYSITLLALPKTLWIDSASNKLYFLDQSSNILRVRYLNLHDFTVGPVQSITTYDNGVPVGLVAADSLGLVYIADAGTAMIFSVDPNQSGAITIVAGCGIPGNSGDGGLALDAQIQGLTGLWGEFGDTYPSLDAILNSPYTGSCQIRVIYPNNDGDLVEELKLGVSREKCLQTDTVDNPGVAGNTMSGANALWVDTSGTVYFTETVYNESRILVIPSSNNVDVLMGGGEDVGFEDSTSTD
eukprot:gene35456-43718_t